MELNGQTDRDLLVSLLTNQGNIERKIDSFGIAIAEVHSRIDRVENKLDDKFSKIGNNCKDQRVNCNTCIEAKLPSKIFYWFIGVSSPIVVGGGAWVLTKIIELNHQFIKISAIIDGIIKTNGG